ncbi:MAG: FMN-binding glutamate synthase family protein [Bdellovibrionales bacterium]
MRKEFYIISAVIFALIFAGRLIYPDITIALWVVVPLFLIGLRDAAQNRQTIRKNYPVIGNIRYLFEKIRPEIQQYFIEHDTDGLPISRVFRSVVYQRAKKAIETVPFGTLENVYAPNYEWVNHSVRPTEVEDEALRVTIGGDDCLQPYSCSLLNISAMSYGSLSKNAVMAFNGGAKLGGFYQNTGEGGISPYHKNAGGDLVWQVGTGYFGCRTKDGNFCPESFKQTAAEPNVKMIELKLSQGAKPGHGGILPKEKVTPEIAEIRGVPMDQDVLSPGAHKAFDTPKGLMEFIKKMRDLSDGKPIGFKLCIGYQEEFLSICKAMIATGIYPDFISVDGSEGGTGAAPLELTNSVGTPLEDALVFVHNTLLGFNIRQKVKIIAAGKVITAFHMVNRMALGADIINSARAMMLSIGCIQALRCHENVCPAGVATTDPNLYRGLNVNNKAVRCANFHGRTMKAFRELIEIVGVQKPSQLRRHHIQRRITGVGAVNLEEIHPYLEKGTLLEAPYPIAYQRVMEKADLECFPETHL